MSDVMSQVDYFEDYGAGGNHLHMVSILEDYERKLPIFIYATMKINSRCRRVEVRHADIPGKWCRVKEEDFGWFVQSYRTQEGAMKRVAVLEAEFPNIEFLVLPRFEKGGLRRFRKDNPERDYLEVATFDNPIKHFRQIRGIWRVD